MRNLAILFVFFIAKAVFSLDGFFTVNEPLADLSAKSIAMAKKQGLQDMLIKFSGDRLIMQSQAIASLLPEFGSMVESFAYLADNQRWIEINFDALAIKKLFNQSGSGYWDLNRPKVLFWLLGKDENIALAKNVIKNQASARGFSALLPSKDLAVEQMILQIWHGDRSFLADKLVLNYVADLQLIVQIKSQDNTINLRGLYLKGDRSVDLMVSADGLDQAMVLLVDKLVDQLMLENTVKKNNQEMYGFEIHLSNIAWKSDYSKVMKVFASMPFVVKSEVVELGDSSLVLSVSSSNNMQFLQNYLANNSSFLLQKKSKDSDTVWYRWMGGL